MQGGRRREVVKTSPSRVERYVDRMEDNCLAKICTDNRPLGIRPVGRPGMRVAES